MLHRNTGVQACDLPAVSQAQEWLNRVVLMGSSIQMTW